jgi:hypothetical protein
MEALVMIVGVLIGAVLLLWLGWALGVIYSRILGIAFWFVPLILGLPFGIAVWESADKMAGNVIVVLSFVAQCWWLAHLIKKIGECNCLVHKAERLLDRFWGMFE